MGASAAERQTKMARKMGEYVESGATWPGLGSGLEGWSGLGAGAGGLG